MGARRVIAAVTAAGLLLAGCGGPSADLFLVERTGTIPGARLSLLVSDDGSARCNGRDKRDMGSSLLLDARELARDLDPAGGRRELAPAPNAVLRYFVRLENGTVSFSDASRGLRPVDLRLAAFTREVARQVCRLRR
jgi:hypothetical protein